MHSTSNELQLFHGMLKKIMTAIGQALQMYDDFVKIHAEDAQPSQKTQNEPTSHKNVSSFNQLRYQEKQKKDRSNKQLEESGEGNQPREFLSYKQRIAALRSINNHIEKQNEKKHPLPTSTSKQAKKNTAFFLYLQDKKDTMMRQFPELRPNELMRILSDNWRAMSEEEKKPFYRENTNNRKNFDQQFQKYLHTVLKDQKRAEKQGEQQMENEQQE